MLRLAYDTETSGVPDYKRPSDDPSQPRVVQLACALFEETGRVVEQFEGIVQPDGWEIPQGAIAVHGLTLETCQKLGQPIKYVLQRFEDMASRAVEHVGFNTSFDQKLVRGEMFRCGMRQRNVPYRLDPIPVVNLQPAATKLCKLAPTEAMMATGRKTFKTARLGEAMQILLGRRLDRAHDAMADVIGVVDLWVYLKDRGALPEPKVWQPNGSQSATSPAPGTTGPREYF